MNKHVVPPETRLPKTDDGNRPDVQELPPGHSAEATARKPQTEQPHAEQPQTAQPQAESPRPGKRDRKAEGRANTSAPETAEANPLQRAYWTRRHLVAAGIFAALLAGAFFWWPFGGNQSKIVYSFTKADRSTVVVTVHSTGLLEPRDPVDIVAPANGQVESLAVKSGDRVSKGQTLARLASDAARAALLSAQADLAARQADLARSQIDIAEARAALTRARSETRPGAADTAEARLARMSANADEARQLVQAAQQSVASARVVLAGLDIRAPFDGTVLKTDTELSNNVRTISRGQPLITMVADLSQLNVRADFPESALGALHAGEPAEFIVPAFPQQTFTAKLVALDLWPKRQVKVDKEIIVYAGTLTGANPDGMLRPGMSANVAIIAAEAKNALVIPNSALGFAPPPKIEAQFPPLKLSAGPARLSRVWVLKNGNPEPRDVALGLSDERVTQVVSGPLREGEDIITSGVVPAR